MQCYKRNIDVFPIFRCTLEYIANLNYKICVEIHHEKYEDQLIKYMDFSLKYSSARKIKNLFL